MLKGFCFNVKFAKSKDPEYILLNFKAFNNLIIVFFQNQRWIPFKKISKEDLDKSEKFWKSRVYNFVRRVEAN